MSPVQKAAHFFPTIASVQRALRCHVGDEEELAGWARPHLGVELVGAGRHLNAADAGSTFCHSSLTWGSRVGLGLRCQGRNRTVGVVHKEGL